MGQDTRPAGIITMTRVSQEHYSERCRGQNCQKIILVKVEAGSCSLCEALYPYLAPNAQAIGSAAFQADPDGDPIHFLS